MSPSDRDPSKFAALSGRSEGIFERRVRAAVAAGITKDTVCDLYAKIGELAVANDIVGKAQELDRQIGLGCAIQPYRLGTRSASCQSRGRRSATTRGARPR